MEKKVEQKNAKQKEKFKKPRPLSFTASLSTLIRTRHFSLWKSKLFFVCWQFLVSHPRHFFLENQMYLLNCWKDITWRFLSDINISLTLIHKSPHKSPSWSAPGVSSVTPQVIRVRPLMALIGQPDGSRPLIGWLGGCRQWQGNNGQALYCDFHRRQGKVN